jgi:putative phosphoribosyl transferase
MRLFRNRRDAGQRLAERLASYRDQHPVVLALPRGGAPVAFEVARELGAPLDVIVVRKLGVPFQPELGMGAVGENGVRVLNENVVRLAGVSNDELAHIEARERAEVEARARRFRGDRAPVPLAGRVAIVVDDGIATGGTARAALRVARAHGAARVVLAVPVAPSDSVRELSEDADEVICLATPEPFFGVGQFYDDFAQVPDEQVVALLDAARATTPQPVAAKVAEHVSDDPPVDPHDQDPRDEDVELREDSLRLFGHLTVPPDPSGLVLFAHGSGSSRHSPRNRYVARVLNQDRIATLLFDLLAVDEELDRRNVFDIELLADRLIAATTWAEREVPGLPIGYFGASTGAGAALWAAAAPGVSVGAVVSRGGRPDLAIPRLAEVRAPTLLIVGGNDDVVVELNREAAQHLRCEHRIEIVPGATHLFEEPGTLDRAAALAASWFSRYLPPRARPAA